MYRIIISNESFFDKDYNKTFSYQKKYDFFGINKETSTIVPLYQELLKTVLGKKVDETFKDFALSKEQTEQIKNVFEDQIDINLSLIEPVEGRRYKSLVFE